MHVIMLQVKLLLMHYAAMFFSLTYEVMSYQSFHNL